MAAVAVTLAHVTSVVPVEAQLAEWSFEGEIGGSLYFGNTSQTTLNSRVATSRADSTYEASTQAIFTYGEAEDEGGDAFVAKRTWELSANLDWRPYATITPFVFGQGTSSFERRIDFRYNAGGGGTYRFVRSESSRADLSLALLAEQTFLREDAPASAEADESVLARWSLRFRARRQLDDERLVLSTENFYRPVVGEYDNYVVETLSSVSYALSEVISLKLSLRDVYDSRAVERGADSNNDGQLVISVLSSF